VARFALGALLLVSSTFSCRVDDSILDEIFTCDMEGGDAQCGTDENGKPMTCYAGSAQLGGKAFCTKSCDPERPAEEGFLCTSSGALLETCKPSESGSCQDPLTCYRTDVFLDEGLCLLVPVCPYKKGTTTRELDNSQCRISHSECGGDILRELTDIPIAVDQLHCVAKPCPSAQAVGPTFPCPQVPILEVCPTDFYSPSGGIPIMCSVLCDRLSCPPNFTCIGSASGGSPPVCLPGIVGMRCTRNEDCIAGDCIDTGAGFSACALPGECFRDEDCRQLGKHPPYTCLKAEPGGKGHCRSTIPFSGANCERPEECSQDLRCGSEPCPPRDCSQYSIYSLDTQHGECRFKCEPDGECPAFGGLPHVCLADGSCFPGTFGAPCTKASDCYADLVCGLVMPDERSRVDASRICTAPCDDDDDCNMEEHLWLGSDTGYCVPSPEPAAGGTGFCRLAVADGRPCERATHCASRCCPTTGPDAGTCVPADRCGAQSP